MKKTTLRIRILAILAQLLATMIWGLNFVSQSIGSSNMDAFTFNFFRMSIGAAMILPVVLARNYRKSGKINFWLDSDDKKETIRGGIICGILLIMGLSSQQIGIRFTSVGKAGFLSSLGVAVVPLIGLAMGNRVKLYQWVGIFCTVVGVGFLSLNNVDGVNVGDLLMLMTSVFVAFHVIVSSHYNKRVDSFQFCVLRFLTGTFLCLIFMLLFEKIDLEEIKSGLPSILYSGIFGSGIAFVLMSLSQVHLDSIATSIIMSLESVFAVLSGWIILGQSLSTREIIGSIIVFFSVLGMQIYGEISNRANIQRETF